MTLLKNNPFAKMNLLGKYSIFSLLLLGIIAICLAWGVGSKLEHNVLNQEGENAAIQVGAILNRYLRPADLTGPLSPDRYEEIDALIRQTILYGHIVRIKVWSRDGTVIYSDDRKLVGHRFPGNEELEEALAGKIAMEISSLLKEENARERGLYDRLMEIYVPLQPGGASQVLGAFEVYHTMDFLKPRIAEIRRFIYLLFGLGFLVLYGSLFMLVRNASRELIHRNEENVRLYEEVKQQLLDRQRAEEALRKSEERYQSLFFNVPVGLYQTTPSGEIIDVNPALAEMLGYCDRESLMSMKSVDTYLDPNDRTRWQALMERGEVIRHFEKRLRRRDGTVIWVEENTRAIRDPQGRTVCFEGSFEDITERKRTQEELRRNYDTQKVINSLLELSLVDIPLEDLLDRALHLVLSIAWLAFESRGCVFMVDDASDSLVMKAENGLAEPLRKACARVPFGKCLCGRAASAKEIQFSNCLDKRHEVGYEGIRPHGHYCVPILSSDKIHGVINVYLKEGHARDQHEETFLMGVSNTLAGILSRKSTEKGMAALQEQLRQSQKMDAIGKLAGGIAHDFNNLLTIIKGYSSLSLEELQEESPLRESIEEIEQAATRASNLTRQLLVFSRRQILESEVLDINAIVQDLEKMLRRTISEDIMLTFRMAEGVGRVKADPGQVEQVILNLVINARDAMPSGGKLTIETANVELDSEYAQAHMSVTPGQYVMLSVSDTGFGMAPEIKERIFEPFFTTKEKGKGTGLGLSTVYGIVKQSGGNIYVYSEPQQGTTFKVYLPRVDEPLEVRQEKKLQKEFLEGKETILLVEDEGTIRKLASTILRKQGYTIWEAAGAREALLMTEGQKEPLNLILTDVVMPEMSGPQLVERVERSHQEAKVLYMSGYTDDAIVEHGVLQKGVQFIQKPFTPHDLARKVREVLDA